MALQALPVFGASPTDLTPILELLDNANFNAVEVWGGSSFDICLRYLYDDPWKRLRTFKKHIKKTPLQMLLRGSNLLGYKHYGKDTQREFLKKAHDAGITRVRSFDSLNDVRNHEFILKTSKELGILVQTQICFIRHQKVPLDNFLRYAKDLQSMGADEIGLLDLSGGLDPRTTSLLILNMKRVLDVPVSIHTRAPGGASYLSTYAALQSGVDNIDASIAPIAIHYGQPSFEVLLSCLEEGTHSLNPDVIREMTKCAFPIVVKKHPGDKMDYLIETSSVSYSIPSGVLQNVVTILTQHGAIYRFKEVLEEIKKIQEEMGNPPLITPVSQLISTQSVYNVLIGERYKIVPKEMRYYFEGWYGKPPCPVDENITAKVLGNREPLKKHVSTIIPDRLDGIKKEIDPSLVEREEDYLTYALFPQAAQRFFKWRKNPEIKPPLVDKTHSVGELSSEKFGRILSIEKFTKFMDENNIMDLLVEDGETSISLNKSSELTPQFATMPTGLSSQLVKTDKNTEDTEEKPQDNLEEIKSPMVGVFYQSPAPSSPPYVKVGDKIEPGKVVCIIEAMKLFNEIKSEISGEIAKICVKNEDVVQTDQPLFKVKVR